MLIFAIIFALLQKSKMLGDPEKAPNVRGINAVVSIVISLIVTLFTPFNIVLLNFLSQLFTGGVIILLAFAFTIIIAVMLSVAKGEQVGKRTWVVVIIGLIIALSLLAGTGVLQYFPTNFPDITPYIPTISAIAVIIIVFVIIYFLARSPKE